MQFQKKNKPGEKKKPEKIARKKMVETFSLLVETLNLYIQEAQ